ncbi:MAG: HAD-superfamily hydrolase, subfamily variant 3 [Aeromicrobium sp.]|nr:HAD-superfamily hydrolase, subfamily variant 3 [Aeromicrobium sp.]
MSGATTAPAIVFDVGGVLSGPPFELLERYAAELGLAPGILPSYFIDDPDFSQVETGAMSMRDFFAGMVRRCRDTHGVEIDPRRMAATFVEAKQLRPEMVALAQQLSAHHTLGVLTNNIKENDEWLLNELPAGAFDQVVNSAVAGFRKPDPRAYEYLLDKLERPGHEVIYIDDFPVNLPPAEALGMRTILFTSPKQCRADLVALGAAC